MSARRRPRITRLPGTAVEPARPGFGIGYNPLSMATTFPEMQEVAHILVRTATQGAKVDPFWLQGAEEIIGILIKCLKNHVDADRYANLANLQYLLQGFGDGHGLTPFVASQCA